MKKVVEVVDFGQLLKKNIFSNINMRKYIISGRVVEKPPPPPPFNLKYIILAELLKVHHLHHPSNKIIIWQSCQKSTTSTTL